MYTKNKLQFYLSFWRSTIISCERVATGTRQSQFYLSFWRSNLISCERVAPDDLNSHFYLSFWRSNLISCERVAPDDLQIALLPQFLAIEPHFVRKGCAGRLANRTFTSVFDDRTSFRAKELRRTTCKSHFYLSFGRSNLISCERVAPDDLHISILPQFLAIEPHFVRKGCVSCRLVGTAPAPAFKREIEKKERARGQDVRRCEDEKIWRWEDEEKMRRWGDEKMRRCEDEKMWRWEDVKMRRCDDEKMWRWEDVKMRRCEDEKMWRCEDEEKMRRWEDEKMRRRWEDEEKMWG